MSKSFLLAFLVACAASIAAGTFAGQTAALALKGVPMVMLIAWAGRPILNGDRERMRIFVFLGLIASIIGDYVIVFKFVGGIVAFFFAHVFYLIGMGRPKSRTPAHALAAVPAGLLWVFMFWMMVVEGKAPPEMRAPVVAYLTVISVMFGRAFGRGLVYPADHFTRLFMVGAGLFVLSDSLIATNKWIFEVPQERLAILSTYYIGQLFITLGIPRSLPGVGAASSGAPVGLQGEVQGL